jgi:hypothetical protein
MTFKEPVRRVDQSAIKVNQALIAALLLEAFLLNSLPLVAFVALVMLAGAVSPELALFQIIYRDGLRPAGVMKPRIVIDNPEPYRFAQGLDGVVIALGLTALMTAHATLGWTLVLLVAAIEAVSLRLKFCAGCFLYYQLNRLGVPRFGHSPIRMAR